MVAPIVDELAEEFDGKVKFAKVDVDTNPQTSLSFGIRSIPSLLVFKDGKVIDQVVGAVPKAVFNESLSAKATADNPQAQPSVSVASDVQ